MDTPESSRSNKRKSTKTSVACVACKTRKSKCSGRPPCDTCTKLNTKCIVDPDSDMRRRDSKDHFKAYKALLDSFVASARNGDLALAKSFYRTMQLTDASGKLAQIAEALMQTISEDPSLASSLLSPQQGLAKANRKATSTSSGEADAMVDVTAGSSPTQLSSIADGEDIPALTLIELLSLKDVDAACQTDPVSLRYPGRRIQGISFHTDGLDLDRQPVRLFEELHAFWIQQMGGRHPPQLFDVVSMDLALDTRLTRAADHMSKAIVDFRNGARRAVQAGARLDDILGSNMPSLETFHSQDSNTPVHSAWSWACQFTRAFPELPLTTQLSTIYLVGIQMRFFIHPNIDTFNDLPPMLRPLRKQYTVEHAASIDICYFPALKDFLLDNQHQYSSLFTKIISTQSCNWPYSDAACFNNCDWPSHTSSLSRAFIEHIRNGQNFTIGADIFEEAPQLKVHGR